MRPPATTLAPMGIVLSHGELLVLAATIREMIQADGEVSGGELESAARVAQRLTLSAEEWEAIWDEAITELPNEDAVKAAAAALHRREAQELLYEILHEVASHDDIVDPEWDLLEWLDEAWRKE